MLKDITAYALVSALGLACLGMLAAVMLKETLEGIKLEPFDE